MTKKKTPYQFSTLPNGLRVVTVPMSDRRSTAVAVWVRVGGRYESVRLSGVSHYLEHMLFKGTRRRDTKQIKQAIEGVGGSLNAFTGEEATCYFAKILRPHFPRAVEVLSDMVTGATLDAREVEKERTVILEEIKMYRDLPSHHVHDLLGEVLWPKHALGRPLSGSPANVQSFRRTDLAGFKKKFYHPSNIVLAVSGSVEHDEVLGCARKAFSARSGGRKSVFDRIVIRQKTPQTLFMEKKTEQTHFVIGLHSCSRYHSMRHAVGLLSMLLGGNMSSRLFEEVREKRGLAYEIRSSTTFYQDTGCLAIAAGVESSKADLTVKVILQQLEKLTRQKVSGAELRRAKDYYLSQLYMGIEDTLDHLLWVSERALYSDDLPDPESLKAKIEAIGPEDIQRVAQKIFQSKNLNLSLIGPVPEKEQEKIRRDFHFQAS